MNQFWMELLLFSFYRCKELSAKLDDNSRDSPSDAVISKAMEMERSLHLSLKADSSKLEKYMDRAEAAELTGDITVLIGNYETKKQLIANYQKCKCCLS